MILVMGLSKTGLSICEYLDKRSTPYLVYDGDCEKIGQFKSRGIGAFCGDGSIDIEGIDLVIKSPGFPPHESHLRQLREAGIKIISDIEFFYREFRVKNIVATTGTNGKTTVTRMIGDMLKSRSAWVAGNIGRPIMEVEGGLEDIYVLELSSFQLNDIDEFKPHVALLLNIEEDHLDWHGNFDNYREAKHKIFKNQDEDDYLIIDSDRLDIDSIKTRSKILRVSLEDEGAEAYFDGRALKFNFEGHKFEIGLDKIRYKQKHNISNLGAAVMAALLMGAGQEDINGFLDSFLLEPHRMETFLEYGGIEFIDDSKATNPSAVLMALKNYDDNIILILGGYDKGTDFSEIFRTYPNIKMFLLEGGIKDKLKLWAEEVGIENYRVFNNLKEATEYGLRIALPGDRLILSPGASSFDEFKSYSERGDRFKEYIKELIDEN